VALTIVWTRQAISGYIAIREYIEHKWTAKEVAAFEYQVSHFLRQLANHPNLLKESASKGIRRGPINRFTIVTYRVKGNRLEILNVRSSRQKPLD